MPRTGGFPERAAERSLVLATPGATAPGEDGLATRWGASTDHVVSAFYWPTVLWVEHPALTMLPVLLFGAGLWQVRRAGHRGRGLLIATVLWGLYAAYEGIMYLWAQRVVAPIRIDLLLLGPLMYGVTALGLVSWWRQGIRAARAA